VITPMAVPHIFLTTLLTYTAVGFPHNAGQMLLAIEKSQPVTCETPSPPAAVTDSDGCT
jgi:hypothetical protein